LSLTIYGASRKTSLMIPLGHVFGKICIHQKIILKNEKHFKHQVSLCSIKQYQISSIGNIPERENT
jgi:hypothetical protein